MDKKTDSKISHFPFQVLVVSYASKECIFLSKRHKYGSTWDILKQNRRYSGYFHNIPNSYPVLRYELMTYSICDSPLRSVTEIATKFNFPLLCVNRIRYDPCAGAKALRYGAANKAASVSIQFLIFPSWFLGAGALWSIRISYLPITHYRAYDWIIYLMNRRFYWSHWLLKGSEH